MEQTSTGRHAQNVGSQNHEDFRNGHRPGQKRYLDRLEILNRQDRDQYQTNDDNRRIDVMKQESRLPKFESLITLAILS